MITANYTLVKLSKNANSITCGYVIALFAIAMLPINGKDSSAINNTYLLSEIRFDYFLHSLLLIPWMLLRMLYKSSGKQEIIFWVITGLLIAILIEIVQYFLPYRTYNVIDLMANIFGVFIGGFLWLIFILIYK